MIEPWGRSPAAGTWPHPTPVWTLAALLLALAGVADADDLQAPEYRARPQRMNREPASRVAKERSWPTTPQVHALA